MIIVMSLTSSSQNENEMYIICGTLRKPSDIQERVRDEPESFTKLTHIRVNSLYDVTTAQRRKVHGA